MNLDVTVASLEQGFANPETIMRRITISSDDMPKYGLRRRGDAEHYSVWCVTVGEQGQQPAGFFDFSLNKAVKKALAWRGIQPKKRAGNGEGAPAAAG